MPKGKSKEKQNKSSEKMQHDFRFGATVSEFTILNNSSRMKKENGEGGEFEMNHVNFKGENGFCQRCGQETNYGIKTKLI